jgi:ribosomal protein S18 acetylase RimI-like enzyme
MSQDDEILIEPAARVDGELIDAIGHLVPQLSSSASAPSPDELRQMIESDATTLLLARDRSQSNRIVGCLTLAVFRIPTGLRAWIEDVIVDGATRSKGIGEALSREAIRIAHDRGARTIELTSRPSRDAANRLYRRLGFEPRDTNVYRLSTRAGPKAG